MSICCTHVPFVDSIKHYSLLRHTLLILCLFISLLFLYHLQKCLISHCVTYSYLFYPSANKFTKLSRYPSELTVMHPLRVYSKSYSRNASFIGTCFECSSSELFIIFKFSSFSVNTLSQWCLIICSQNPKM